MKDLTIAIVVSHSLVGQLHHNLDRMKYWISEAARRQISMICFPELNLTGYTTRPDIRQYALPLDSDVIREINELAVHHNITVLFGMAESGPDNRFYATHLVIRPDSSPAAYRKVHISPPEKDIFSPGNGIPVFDGPLCRFGIQLCYDAHFPELSSQMAVNGAEIIFMPHASPRGTSADKFDSWMRHLTARAYDNSVFVVAWNQVGENSRGLTFPGLAVVIGPDGKLIDKKFFQEEGVIAATLKGSLLSRIRDNRMHFFLPHRRPDLYG